MNHEEEECPSCGYDGAYCECDNYCSPERDDEDETQRAEWEQEKRDQIREMRKQGLC